MSDPSRTAVEPSSPGPGKAGVLPEGTRLMEYEIRRVLGKPGGFGVTYLALDTNLDHEVAIKEYLPLEFALRMFDGSIAVRSEEDAAAFEWGRRCFLNEARLLARFNHPNVVQVHRLFEAHGTAYIVMDYVRGRSLAEELHGTAIAGQARLEALLLPLLDGLETVHAAGVLHRDLKPQNIVLRQDGTPVLIDFGAARGELGSHSRSLLNVLTAGYAPIEQYSQQGNQGPWSDIYAMGAVLHRALTGRKPPDAVDRLGEDPLQPLESQVGGDFDANFLRAIDWSLRVPIAARPQNIADWRRALTGQTLVAPPPAASPNQASSSLDLDVSLDPTSALEDPDAAERTQPLAPEKPVRVPAQALLPQEPRSWLPRAAIAAGAVIVLLLAGWYFGSTATPPSPEPAVEEAAATGTQPEQASPQSAETVLLPEPEPPPVALPDEPAPGFAPARARAAPPTPVTVTAKSRTPAAAPLASHPPPSPELTDMLPPLNYVRQQAGVSALNWAQPNVRQAQQWAGQLAAEGCKPRPNPDAAHRAQYRDTLFHAYASAPYEGWRRTPGQVVARWNEGSRHYSRDKGACLQAEGGCSQYAQLVDPEMRKVGCARARCEISEVWVCTYSAPPGG
ncbi:protein kinase domain-containing protein [Solimonas sp. K1W22B-7]|uniref:protein kinase domain-containing protein n=1 Tax=Solimonas sp. K1W22B-7 TaxID=2303331 RepID=UPI0013C4DABE|nr:CAP domain-containing protein [Solimonas sp. K1W22B-7]